MQRHAIGIVALAILAVAVVTHGESDAALSGTCLRIGCVMALLWLAWPQLSGVPRWLVAVIAASLLVIMRWPRLLLVALPLAGLLWLLRPRTAGRGKEVADPRD